MAIGLFDQRTSDQRSRGEAQSSSRDIARRSVEKVSRAIDEAFAPARQAKTGQKHF